MEEITLPSPDGRKIIILEYDGEARFGPAFFVGGSRGFAWPLGSSTLGEDVHWSPDSRYAVLLLFRSRDTSKSPDVDLVAIDTNDGSLLTIDHNANGLIEPRGFVSSGEYEYRYIDRGSSVMRSWRPKS